MIRITPQVTVTFGDKLRKAADSLGVTVGWLLQDQMRLMCQDMIKITAPARKVIAAATGSTDLPNDRKIGQGAIFHDLYKIFWNMSDDMMVFYKGKRKRATLAEMASFHESHRNKQTGRTFKPTSGGAPNGKFMVPNSLFLRYVRTKEKNVGKLKSSWVKPMLHYQSKVGGRASVPGWVRRHSTGQTTINETVVAGQVNAVTVTNNTNLIREKVDPSALAAAMRTRDKDLQGQIMKRADRIVAQFNANQQPQPAIRQSA